MRASWAGDTIVSPCGAVVVAINRLVNAMTALPGADQEAILGSTVRDVILGAIAKVETEFAAPGAR